MKLIYLLSAFALTFSLGSCNNEQPAEDKTTIIKVESPQVESPKVETPKVEVVEEKKSTSVKINPSGASVNTSEVEIEVSK